MAGVFDRAAGTYDAVGVSWCRPIAVGLVGGLTPQPGAGAMSTSGTKGPFASDEGMARAVWEAVSVGDRPQVRALPEQALTGGRDEAGRMPFTRDVRITHGRAAG